MSLMSNVLAFPAQPVLSKLRRPAPLIRAAVAGQSHWRRDRDLRRTCAAIPCLHRARRWHGCARTRTG